MAGNSAIEWTESTWNPIVGCSIFTPGCINCFAMEEAARQIRCSAALGRETHYAGTVKTVKGKAVWTGKLALAPESILLQPLKRKNPTIYFVNSMGDLFHEDCPDEWIDRVFAVMALSPQHTFQVLTKRAKRMHRYFTNADHHEAMRGGIRSPGFTVVQRIQALVADYIKLGKFQINGFGPVYKEDWERAKPHLRPLPLPNVWLGVSTERQHEANERIPLLLKTPAAVRFISAEPLLGPIDLEDIVTKGNGYEDHRSALECDVAVEDDEEFHGATIDWVIAGGESGKSARPMHPDWVRCLREQCFSAGVPFFFKQWGEHWPAEFRSRGSDGEIWRTSASGKDVWFMDELHAPDPVPAVRFSRVGKRKAGRLLDGKFHDEFPTRED